jgi:electron transport complex protein RnfB
MSMLNHDDQGNEESALIEKVNNLLPQTQCGQCGFSGCQPYAVAMVKKQAEINQCPPGGEEGIHDLAKLLNKPFKMLNPKHGEHKPEHVAFIIEDDCIGCVKCLAACPVDAIVGAAKYMHTVIAAECTGCELCIAPCPVDCIIMQPVSVHQYHPTQHDKASLAKRRFDARNERKQLEAHAAELRRQQKKALLSASKEQ